MQFGDSQRETQMGLFMGSTNYGNDQKKDNLMMMMLVAPYTTIMIMLMMMMLLRCLPLHFVPDKRSNLFTFPAIQIGPPNNKSFKRFFSGSKRRGGLMECVLRVTQEISASGLRSLCFEKARVFLANFVLPSHSWQDSPTTGEAEVSNFRHACVGQVSLSVTEQ